MTTLQVFDPPMCCSTGICGPSVDPVLPRFQQDYHWLSEQGIAVERYNLSQQPHAFTGNAAIKQALAAEGTACLPLILVNGEIASKGRYPGRDELARMVGLVAKTQPANALPIVCGPGSGCC